MAEDFPITIFHNPACGTSRTVLATLREAGASPTVVEYLKAGWTRPQLQKLFAKRGPDARARPFGGATCPKPRPRLWIAPSPTTP